MNGALAVANSAVEEATQLERIGLLNTTAVGAAERGELESAADTFRAVLDLARGSGQPTDEATAAAFAADALKLSSELGMTSQIAFGVLVAARILARKQRWWHAAVMQRAVEVMLEATGVYLFPSDQDISDQLLADALDHLGVDDFETASNKGRETATEAAVTEALELLDQIASRSDVG